MGACAGVPAQRQAAASAFAAGCGECGRAGWAEVTRLFDDANIYQTWEYGAACWKERELSHLILRRNGRIVAAAQVRVVKTPVIRGGVAYVRYGPLVRPRGAPWDEGILREMTRALIAEYVERRGLMLRMVPNVCAGDAPGEAMAGIWREMGLRLDPEIYVPRTILLDLAAPVEALRMGLHQRWRNKLKHAESSGYGVREGTGDELFGIFEAMFHEMMRRKRFETNVDVGEHREMQRLLDAPAKMHVLICEKDGRPRNGLVFSTMGEGAIYLLGATSDEGLCGNGAYLLQWLSVLRAKQLGCRWYDLGGIHPEKNPGGYQFKSGMGGREVALIGAYVMNGNPVNPLALRWGERLHRFLRASRAAMGMR